MGTITRSFANNITTSGVLLPASLTNNSIANVTAYNASVATGGMKLISSQTASNSASISFTTSIDSTYKEYQFYFINIHARTNATEFTFQASTNAGSSYGVALTSTAFRAAHQESGAGQFGPDYADAHDLAQSTSFQNLTSAGGGISSDADMAENGILSIFNPSSTTYVKHWLSNFSHYNVDVYSHHNFHAGYFNTTSAINAVQFKMISGNFDGTILMYGIV